MIASGWRTAPLQNLDSAAVLVTNSECTLSQEASQRVSDSTRVALSASHLDAPTAELFSNLAPVIVHPSFLIPRLSVTTVGCR